MTSSLAALETTPLTVLLDQSAGFAAIDLLQGASVPEGTVLVVGDMFQASGPNASYTLHNGVLTLDLAQSDGLSAGGLATLVFTYTVKAGELRAVQTLTLSLAGRSDALMISGTIGLATNEDADALFLNLLAGGADPQIIDATGSTPQPAWDIRDTLAGNITQSAPRQSNFPAQIHNGTPPSGLAVSNGGGGTTTPAAGSTALAASGEGMPSPPGAAAVSLLSSSLPDADKAGSSAGVTVIGNEVASSVGGWQADGDAARNDAGIASSDVGPMPSANNPHTPAAFGRLQVQGGTPNGNDTVLASTAAPHAVFWCRVLPSPSGKPRGPAATNHAPMLTVSNVATDLMGNQAGLTLATVAAIDPEGGACTFSVDDGRFEVVDGELRLKAGASLDYDAVPGGQGTVTVTVTDALGATTSQTVGYTVVDASELLVANADGANTAEDTAVTIDVLANDQYASNTARPTITSASASHGSVTINADGTLAYVPGANRSDPAVITYTLTEDGKTATGQVSVAIIAQADAPVLGIATASGDVSDSIPLNISAALTGLANSESLSSVTINGLPAQAQLSAGTRNEVGDWIVPASQLAGLTVTAGLAGIYTLTVSATATEASNGSSFTTTAKGTLTITGNAVPTLTVSDVAGGLMENQSGLRLATVAATDPEGDALTFTVSDSRFEVVGGELRLKATASLDYEAVPGGQGAVTVTVTDALGATASQTVGYSVVDASEPLVANADQARTAEDIAVTIDVLANDQYASNTARPTITSASASHGSVTINADGTLTYVPGANRSDPAVITYTLTEDDKTATGQVSVAIIAQADAPVLGGVSTSGSIYAPIPLNISAALTDLDNSESLSSVTIKGLPAQAQLSAGTRNEVGDWIVPASQLAGLTVTAGQAGGYTLVVSVTAIEASNGSSFTTTAKGTLTITGNAVPTLTVSDVAGGLVENQSGLRLATVAATDPEGSACIFSVDDDRFEVVDGELRLKADASLDYEAAPGGQGAVTVTVTDALGGSASQTVNYSVVDASEPLVANADGASTAEDTAVTIDVLANDQYASPARRPTITSASANHGSVTINADGTLTYVPGANRSDPATITYTLTEDGKTSTAQVAVAITAQADAPVLGIAAASGDASASIPLNISAALTDLDNSESLSSITINGLPAQAQLSAGTRNGVGDWIVPASQLAGLTVTAGLAGIYTLTVSATATEASNGSNRTSTVTGTLTVTGNSAPVLTVSDVATGLMENQSGLKLATVTATDPEGDALTFTVSDSRFEVVGGELRLKATASLDYEAVSGGNGAVTVTVKDARGATSSQKVSYTVIDVNEPLLARDDVAATIEDKSVIINVLANDLYASPTRRPTITSASASHGSVTINANGTLTYVPGANRSDTAVITYTLAENGKTSTAQVSVSLDARADTPLITFAGAAGAPFTQIPLELTAELSDTDGSESLSITVGGLPADAWLSAGTLLGNGNWVLSANQLPGLTLFASEGGSFTLTVTATAVEGANGTTSVRSVTGTLNITSAPTILADWLYGTAGNDSFFGQPGADFIRGRNGVDSLYGQAGDDYLVGDAGNDVLFGGGGNDILDGGDGNDCLSDDDGENTIYGGAGNDIIKVWFAVRSLINAGSGDDRIELGLQGATVVGGEGRDTFSLSGSVQHQGDSNVIMDFKAGAGGDILDLTSCLDDVARLGWDGRSNPFTQNFLRLVDSNGATEVQFKRNNGSYIEWVTLGVLANTQASSLTGDNFVQSMNFDPSGVLSPGMTILSTSTATETLKGGSGDDTLTGGAGVSSLLGGAGNDVLSGGAGDDVIHGGYGNDTVLGGAGNDWLYGGSPNGGELGSDLIDGGDGNDTITASFGHSTVYGGNGNDQIWFGSERDCGANTVDMGGGDDTVRLGAYDGTTVTTGAGRDIIDTSNASRFSTANVITDFAVGAGGDQIDLSDLLQFALIGWTASNNPFGSAGFLRVRQVGADTVIEADRDGAAFATNDFKPILILRNVQASELTQDNFVPAYDPTGAAPAGVTLVGGNGNDTQTGTPGGDTLSGGAGNDYILGGDGADLLRGEDGNDVLFGDAGDDVMDGGAGDDRLYDWGGDDWLYGGDGNDRLVSDTGRNHLFGGNGNDGLQLWSTAGDVADAGAGNDTIYTNCRGSGGVAATITTGAGQDTVEISFSVSSFTTTAAIITDFTAGAGGDVIALAALQEFNLVGWNGSANPFGSGFLRVVQVGSDALLQMDADGDNGSGGWLSLVVLNGVDASQLTADNFFPAFPPDGSGVPGMMLNGGSGADMLVGTYGDDALNGGAGCDTLTSGSGSDRLSGGDGDDTLDGGMGRDTLSGGSGQDVYRFSSSSGVDTIVNATDNLDGAPDTVLFTEVTQSDNLWFARVGNNLEVSQIGSDARVILADWYSANPISRVQTFKLNDGTALDQSQVENLVSAMATFAPPDATQTQLTAQQHQALDGVIATSWLHG